MSGRKYQQLTNVKRNKNELCNDCTHWKRHEQFCKLFQTYSEDIILCSSKQKENVQKQTKPSFEVLDSGGWDHKDPNKLPIQLNILPSLLKKNDISKKTSINKQTKRG